MNAHYKTHVWWFHLLMLLCVSSWPSAAEELVSEEESWRYYHGLMQNAQAFKVHPAVAPKYLRGVWRLDRKAHVGGRHYVRAERGDDVTLICNGERLIQIDFNRNDDTLIEFTAQLSDLTGHADGYLHFGKGTRRIVPLDRNHLAVFRYDYVAVLERVSGTPRNDGPSAFPAE